MCQAPAGHEPSCIFRDPRNIIAGTPRSTPALRSTTTDRESKFGLPSRPLVRVRCPAARATTWGAMRHRRGVAVGQSIC